LIKKYFIPSKENEYKPHLLRGQGVAILLTFVILIELGIVGQTSILLNGSQLLATVLPAVLVDLTNTNRTQNHVDPLTVNAGLQKAAQLKADDMAAKGYFSHTTPEGYAPWYWLDKVGYRYDYAGENLAVNFFESADVEQAWMNSPEHRANIVKSNYTQIGIATATGTYQGKTAIFVVQFFGSPKTTNTQNNIVAASVAATSTLAAKTASSSVLAASTQAIKSVITSQNNVINNQRSAGTAGLEIILALIVIALLLSIFIEIRIQHPQIILNGLFLLTIIGLTILLNTRLFATYTTITIPDAVTAGSTIHSL
jgi:hypothetical protein